MSKFLTKVLNNDKIYFIVSIIFLLLSALLITEFIQYRGGNGSFFRWQPVLFIISTLIILLILIIISAICNNVFLGTAIMGSIIFLFTFADRAKWDARGEHIIPSDFITATNLSGMSNLIDYGQLARQFIYVVVMLAVGIFITVIIKRYRKPAATQTSKYKSKKANIIFRLVVIVLSSCLLMITIAPFKDVHRETVLNFTYTAWNQVKNYNNNGMVLGFVSNLRTAEVKMPEDYSKERVTEIVDKYKSISEERNNGKVSIAEEEINIIYVMNESFVDLTKVSTSYPYEGEDITPNLHELENSTVSGNVITAEYGGGTADVEFEVLTGFATYLFDAGQPFQDLLPKGDGVPSIASMLNSVDFETSALHPYNPGMYRRQTVYPLIGFDNFWGKKDFLPREEDQVSFFYSDMAAYKELEERLSDSLENNFMHLVTMQNHASMEEDFPFFNFKTLVDGPEQELRRINEYMMLLSLSDEALPYLIDIVDNQAQKTVVVFWGDHYAGFMDRAIFEEEDKVAHTRTPIFIYSNFKNDNETMDDMSMFYISTTLFDYIEAKKPAYYYLLDEVKKDYPILTKRFLQDQLGNEKTVSEYTDVEYNEQLSDYMMIAYDTLSGKGYAKELGFFDIQ